jgi:TolA-binding protein
MGKFPGWLFCLLLVFSGTLVAQEQQMYSNVIRKIRANDLSGAESALEKLRTKYPKSRFVVDSSLALIERNSDYFDSLVRLKKLLSDFPEYPEQDLLLYRLSTLYYLHNNYSEAMKGFLSLGTNYPNSAYRAASYYWAGNIAFFRKEYPRAEYYYWESIKSKRYDSFQPLSALRLGDLAFEQGRYYSAITNYKRAIKEYVDRDVHLEGSYWLAESYAKVRNYKESEKYYAFVAREFPDSELGKRAANKLTEVAKKKYPFLQKNEEKRDVAGEMKAGLSYYVQVASFHDARSANNLRLALKKDGWPVLYKVEGIKKGYVYNIRLGKYPDREEAETVAKQVRERYKMETRIIEDVD